jgi:hypothetical protein
MTFVYTPAHKVTGTTHAPSQLRPGDKEIQTLADAIQESNRKEKDRQLGIPPKGADPKEASSIRLAASIKMVCNALERDATEGKTVRGEMAEELRKDFSAFLDAHK